MIPKFNRVRTVILNTTGFSSLDCTCGSTQNMLIPCVHILAVIYSVSSECSLENVHYRWYGHHAYQHEYSRESNMATMPSGNVHQWSNRLDDVKLFFNKYFCSSTGRYNGCPISSEQLHLFCINTDALKPVILVIIETLNWNIQHGPKESLPSETSTIDTFISPEDCVHRILSQRNVDRNRSNQNVLTKSLAQEMCMPVIRRFIDSVTSLEDIAWFEDLIESFATRKQIESQRIKGNTDNSMYGSDICNQRIVKRHRFAGEKRY